MIPQRPSIQSSPIDAFASVLADPTRRMYLLIGIGYLSALSGISLSVFGGAGNTNNIYSTVGIGLMGLSFVALFIVSVMILDLSPETRSYR